MIIMGVTPVDKIVKLDLNNNVKIKFKTFVNGWVWNLADLLETRSLGKSFSTDPMFSMIYLIFVPTD